MKKYFLLFSILLSLIGKDSFSQTLDWVWARSASLSTTGGGLGGAEGFNVASDTHDNVFVCGNHTRQITYGSYSLPGAGACVAKLDSAGNVKWIAGGNCVSGALSYGVCADRAGNCYLVGYYSGTITFGSTTYTNAGNYDTFLAKYDTSGNLIWVRTAGGTGDDFAYSVTTDLSGNVYISGGFTSPTLGFGSVTLSNIGSSDLFLVKYDSSGTVIWAKSAAGTYADVGFAVAADALGHVYVTGYFSSPGLTFGANTLSASGLFDVFLAKYDSSGNALWGRSAGGTNYDRGYSVATDSISNIYISGYSQSTSITFGSTTLTNAGGTDAFIASYDSAGNARWAKGFGGSGNDDGYSVSALSGKIYMSGNFSSPAISIDTFTLTRPSGTNDPLFVAAFDPSGSALWAKQLSSGGDDNNGVVAAGSGSGAVYVASDLFINPLIVGHDTLPLIGGEDMFVAKLFFNGIHADFTSSDTVFCAETGQCIDFYDHSTGNPTSWQWIFTGGNPSNSSLQNPTQICYNIPGTYPVTLIVGNSSGYDTMAVTPLIIYNTVPPPPTITTIGADTLISSHGFSYQWFLNGFPISAATDSFYVAVQPGTYSVQIRDNLGCRSISGGVVIANVFENTFSDIRLYPNPVSDELTIMLPAAHNGSSEKYSLFITDCLGRTVENVMVPPNQRSYKLSTADYLPGIYSLHFILDNHSANLKFSVVK